MDLNELAQNLSSLEDPAELESLLRGRGGDDPIALVNELKNVCYETWNTEPAMARGAADAARVLASLSEDPEVRAIESWIRGIAFLTKGELESSVNSISESLEFFRELGKPVEAARATVAMLIPLSLLGRYEEAVEAGTDALKAFEECGDELAAGKIELNLSNIASRKGDHRESERYGIAARDRFIQAGEAEWRTLAENDLANTYAELNEFGKAEENYETALASAREAGMAVTEAEIEASLGNLATFRGRYDEALKHLEMSRRMFEDLDMPHQSAIAELEIGCIYQTLNLLEEAAELHERAAEKLKELKLQGEEARARADLGRVRIALGDPGSAFEELEKSAKLFTEEGRNAGTAEVLMIRARIELAAGETVKALATLTEAAALLSEDHARLGLECRFLTAEALRAGGDFDAAGRGLLETRRRASDLDMPNLALLAINSLGLLALDREDPATAKREFYEAVSLTEAMREPIAAEEFRMAYLTDKLAPYDNLTDILIAEGDLAGALEMNERARSRTLAEAVAGSRLKDGAADEGPLAEERNSLRETLNWLYARIGRAEDDEVAALTDRANETERRLSDISRRIESTREATGPVSAGFSTSALMEALGTDRALVEYVERGEGFGAFVVTSEGIEYIDLPVDQTDVLGALEHLRFQFGAMRYGESRLGAFASQLKARADAVLSELHSMIFQDLLESVGERDVAVVPAGVINYVPFPALFDGEAYEAERREFVSVPGASVWMVLESRPEAVLSGALLIGRSDEYIPNAEAEIEEIENFFDKSLALTGGEASFSNYGRNAEDFHVIHLACHGRFRPDNPYFSSLHLADGFITVRDICRQRLKPGLVTLSACETGLNSVYPGNEILGLARGFLTAGTSTIVLSLWTVSDSATRELMTRLYSGLQRGSGVSASLNAARRKMISDGLHPYFWAPFGIIGRR